MKISMSHALHPQSPLRLSNGAENQAVADRQQKKQADSVTVSSQARSLFAKNNQSKTNDLMQSLQPQREKLQESKSKLYESALKSGGQAQGIQEQIKALDEQIRALDEQISQIKLDEMQKTFVQDADSKQPTPEKPADAGNQTAEEPAFQHFMALSGNLEQLEQLSAQKHKIARGIRVLNQEIKLDESRALSGQTATAKREQVAALEQTMGRLDEQMGEKFKALAAQLIEQTNFAEAESFSTAAPPAMQMNRAAASLRQKTPSPHLTWNSPRNARQNNPPLRVERPRRARCCGPLVKVGFRILSCVANSSRLALTWLSWPPVCLSFSTLQAESIRFAKGQQRIARDVRKVFLHDLAKLPGSAGNVPALVPEQSDLARQIAALYPQIVDLLVQAPSRARDKGDADSRLYERNQPGRFIAFVHVSWLEG